MPRTRNSVCFMGIVLKLYFSLITTLVEYLACGRHLIDIYKIDKSVDKLIILTLYKEPFRKYSVGDSVPSRKLLARLNVAAIDVIPGGEWRSGVGSVYCLKVTSNQEKEASRPHSWAAFLRPSWKSVVHHQYSSSQPCSLEHSHTWWPCVLWSLRHAGVQIEGIEGLI